MSIFISCYFLRYVFAKAMEHDFNSINICTITQAIISKYEKSCNSAGFVKIRFALCFILSFSQMTMNTLDKILFFPKERNSLRVIPLYWTQFKYLDKEEIFYLFLFSIINYCNHRIPFHRWDNLNNVSLQSSLLTEIMASLVLFCICSIYKMRWINSFGIEDFWISITRVILLMCRTGFSSQQNNIWFPIIWKGNLRCLLYSIMWKSVKLIT